MPHHHQGHDRHAGHSVAMFRDKFWLSLALTIPTVIWSSEVQHWLGLHGARLPRLQIPSRHPRNHRLPLRRRRFPAWRTCRTCRPQTRHDDAHQSGHHRCLCYLSRRDIWPVRNRRLVGACIADYDHGSRPLAGNARHFSGSWRDRCPRRPAPGHCRACNRRGSSNRSIGGITCG